jgi:hypothetical protein
MSLESVNDEADSASD